MKNEWLLNALHSFAKWICRLRFEAMMDRRALLKADMLAAQQELDTVDALLDKYETTLSGLEGAQ